jgi:hypothetical protein
MQAGSFPVRLKGDDWDSGDIILAARSGCRKRANGMVRAPDRECCRGNLNWRKMPVSVSQPVTTAAVSILMRRPAELEPCYKSCGGQSRIIWNWQRDVPLKTHSNLKRFARRVLKIQRRGLGQSTLKLFFYCVSSRNRIASLLKLLAENPRKQGFPHIIWQVCACPCPYRRQICGAYDWNFYF